MCVCVTCGHERGCVCVCGGALVFGCETLWVRGYVSGTCTENKTAPSQKQSVRGRKLKMEVKIKGRKGGDQRRSTTPVVCVGVDGRHQRRNMQPC